MSRAIWSKVILPAIYLNIHRVYACHFPPIGTLFSYIWSNCFDSPLLHLGRLAECMFWLRKEMDIYSSNKTT